MPKERPRILVVDDAEADNLLVSELFAMYNYEVIHAPDPQTALDIIEETSIDSIIISIDQPGGGFEFSQRVQRLQGMADIPLVFVTAEEVDSALLMEAQFYGGLFLHRKPYKEVELLAQLSTMIRIKLLQDELKERMDELDRLASTDPLTGLYNRRLFFQRFEEEIAKAGRKPMPACVFYLDIDNFKKMNDTYGHQAGDEVLKKLSEMMGRLIRRSDILGRIGGEEFAILLPDTAFEAGRLIAERIRQRIEKLKIIYQGVEINPTMSIGICFAANLAGYSIDSLVKKADDMLYEAKDTGRNRVVSGEIGIDAVTPD